MQKLKNNEARPKFTGSYKKKSGVSLKSLNILLQEFPGEGYFGAKRIGMTVGNPRKTTLKIPSHKICAP